MSVHLQEHTGIVEAERERREKFARWIKRRVSYEISTAEVQHRIRRQVSAELLAEVDRIIAERKAVAEADRKARQMAELDGSKPRAGIPARDIIQAVSDASGVSYDGLVGPRRSRNCAYPRHVAMLLFVELRSDLSLPAIGRIFGGRDHTTCLAARDRARERIAQINSASADIYRAAKALLAERFPECSNG